MLTSMRSRVLSYVRMVLGRPLALLLILLVTGALGRAASPITLVQQTSKDGGTTNSLSLAFPANNTSGNFIAVLIRAGKSGQVLTVSDSNVNKYSKAVQLNETLDTPNGETFAIYYAENISGGSNTITVANSIAGQTLRIIILEYSGVAALNSLDTAAAGQGTGTAPSSGPATTTANGDLLLGEIVTANPATVTAGAGYVVETRVPPSPNTKLAAEDEVQVTAGTASATASLAKSDAWGAALAAFKAAAGGSPTPTTTTAANASTTFNSSNQNVTLSATVTSGGGTVNAGTVTFTVSQGGTTIGTPVTSGTVTGGAASATFVLPGGTATGTYTITAAYSGGGGFSGSSDNTHTLTVTTPTALR
jgi:trimeric autotransporter adhesin